MPQADGKPIGSLRSERSLFFGASGSARWSQTPERTTDRAAMPRFIIETEVIVTLTPV